MVSSPYIPGADDPFASSPKIPSLSWKGLPVGAVFTLRIIEPAKLLHSRNFETNLPDYWDDEKTQPKMSAVINAEVMNGPHSVGEMRSIWAQKPSNLFAAIAEAQRVAGVKIAEGGVLHVKFASETPHENKRYSAIKNYAAKYEPPAEVPDVFHSSAPQAYQTPPAGQTGARPLAPVDTRTVVTW